jgi:hypothetical protein
MQKVDIIYGLVGGLGLQPQLLKSIVLCFSMFLRLASLESMQDICATCPKTFLVGLSYHGEWQVPYLSTNVLGPLVMLVQVVEVIPIDLELVLKCTNTSSSHQSEMATWYLPL